MIRISDESEMSARIHGHDWAGTPLGRIEDWPHTLRISVDIMLGAAQPAAVHWGPELTLLYNDPWAAFLGKKHPSALGKPLADVYPEIWDTIGPLLDHVMSGGGAVVAKERLLYIDRAGSPERAWFNINYNPIPDGSGIGGVLNFSDEVTEKIEAVEALRESEARYRGLFESIEEGYALCQLVRDENGNAIDADCLECNDAFVALAHLADPSPPSTALRSVLDNSSLELANRVIQTGRPEHVDAWMSVSGHYFDIQLTKVESPQGSTFSMLLRDVTGRKRREQHAALLLATQDDFSRLSKADEILSAVGSRFSSYLQLTSFSYADVDAEEFTVNYSWSADGEKSFIGNFRMTDVIPERVIRALRSGETVFVGDARNEQGADPEFYEVFGVGSWVGLPFHQDGQWRYALAVTARGQRDWRIEEVTLIEELANRLFPRLERARAEALLRESELRYRSLFESIDEGLLLARVIYDEDGEALDVLCLEENGAARNMTQTSYAGRRLSEIDPERGVDLLSVSGRVGSTGVGERLERYSKNLGRWFDLYVCPFGEGGESLALVFQDITRRKEAEEALRKINQTLEERVAARTSELERMNEALEHEVMERKAAEVGRRRLLRQLITAEEDERRRLSRELHDHLGQGLTALLLGLRGLQREAVTPENSQRAVDLEQLAMQIATDAQNLAVELRPPALDTLGLSEALQNHLEDWGERHRIQTDFHAMGLDGVRFPTGVETTVYRIIQEGLTNTLKHAGASHVSLVLKRRAGLLRIVLEDDGCGFDPAGAASSSRSRRLGLIGMKERLALLGGALEVDSTPGAGTSIFATLPDQAEGIAQRP